MTRGWVLILLALSLQATAQNVRPERRGEGRGRGQQRELWPMSDVPPKMEEDLSTPSGKIRKGWHPALVRQSREEVREKIRNYPWAAASFDSIRSSVEKYVDIHRRDPEWIVSRLAMYWKDGEHYTQCYLKKQNWDYGEGNAPVPTVRLPGMRTWNEYLNVPLEDRIPYNETGDMLAIDRRQPDLPPVRVPYKQSGHLVRSNNQEILTLAENAAFVYWVTGEKKFAKFASDIFQTWLVGTYYMQPILDPDRSTGGFGGWEPGGICGYYDYEQIHDDIPMHASAIYAFAFDYMASHTSRAIKKTRKNIKDISEIVFKRFVNLGMVRGQRTGNWNINGWNCILKPILVLDDDAAFKDGQGRQYYLHYLTGESTIWRTSIPDAVRFYDPVTGLWPESPGYAFGTVGSILGWSDLLLAQGIDIIAENPVLEKAALAVFPWMDDRSNMVVFGDGRGGPADFKALEYLLSYYEGAGNQQAVRRVAGALQAAVDAGAYDRQTDWSGLCSFVGNIPSTEAMGGDRVSYSPFHRFVTMKNPGVEFPMMACLYGGKRGAHLSQNGLALQFYGYGYALAPDAAAYVSYWSEDNTYHQRATGSNTIIPGYQEGPVEIVSMEPAVPEGAFACSDGVSPFVNYADMKAGEKERLAALVRTSDESGYYVDYFLAGLDSCDYWMHTVGESLTVSSAEGNPLLMTLTGPLEPAYLPGYSFLSSLCKGSAEEDFIAGWDLPEDLGVRFWMKGVPGREVITAQAPPTTLSPSLTPLGTSSAPNLTPTLIVRQHGKDAREHPFLGIYEPYKGEASVTRVVAETASSDGFSMLVESRGGIVDRICRGGDGSLRIIRERDGLVEMLYLSGGTTVSSGGTALELETPGHACLWRSDGRWVVSSTVSAQVVIQGEKYLIDPVYEIEIGTCL